MPTTSRMARPGFITTPARRPTAGRIVPGHGFSAFFANGIHYHGVEAAFTNIDPEPACPTVYQRGHWHPFRRSRQQQFGRTQLFARQRRTGIVVSHQGSNNTASYNVIANNGGNRLVVNGKNRPE